MASRKTRRRELDPFVKGKIANMHADIGAAYGGRAVRGGGAEYERALALCPTFVDIRTELGDSLRAAGDLAAAEREFAKAREEHPAWSARG